MYLLKFTILLFLTFSHYEVKARVELILIPAASLHQQSPETIIQRRAGTDSEELGTDSNEIDPKVRDTEKVSSNRDAKTQASGKTVEKSVGKKPNDTKVPAGIKTFIDKDRKFKSVIDDSEFHELPFMSPGTSDGETSLRQDRSSQNWWEFLIPTKVGDEQRKHEENPLRPRPEPAGRTDKSWWDEYMPKFFGVQAEKDSEPMKNEEFTPMKQEEENREKLSQGPGGKNFEIKLQGNLRINDEVYKIIKNLRDQWILSGLSMPFPISLESAQNRIGLKKIPLSIEHNIKSYNIPQHNKMEHYVNIKV